jgi:hypothetical protein
VFSVNKMLRSLSSVGRGVCVGRARVSREVWVADFAMSGWVELAQMRGYLSARTVLGICRSGSLERGDLMRGQIW